MSPQRRREIEEILAICERAHAINKESGTKFKADPEITAGVIRDLLREADTLREALRGLFKPDSIPYAQWTREMHAAHIALESE